MKAIILEEDRFKEFLKLLELTQYNMINSTVYDGLRDDIGESAYKELVNQIYRKYHYEFVKWAQSHGASCT